MERAEENFAVGRPTGEHVPQDLTHVLCPPATVLFPSSDIEQGAAREGLECWPGWSAFRIRAAFEGLEEASWAG